MMAEDDAYGEPETGPDEKSPWKHSPMGSCIAAPMSNNIARQALTAKKICGTDFPQTKYEFKSDNVAEDGAIAQKNAVGYLWE